MYCTRCKIKTEDTFCENCGGATVASEEVAATSTTVQADISYPIQEKIKNEVGQPIAKKITVKKILSITIALVLVIGVLTGYNILSKQYTPRKTVEKYYNYLVNKDYDNAYKMLINTDNNFLNKDIYTISIQQVDFSQYTIKNYNSNDFPKSYNPKNNNLDTIGNMFSVQTGGYLYPVGVVNLGKKLLVFNDYKIEAGNFTTKWQLTAPIGAKVLVAGKETVKSNDLNLDVNFNINPNSFYKPETTVYEVGSIFNGKYDITASMEGAKDVNYKGAVAGKKINIKFEPTEELSNQLQEKAKKFVDLYYTNASQEKYSEIVTQDSNALTRVSILDYANNSVVNKVQDIKVINKSIDDGTHATITVKCTINYEDSSWVAWGGTKQTGTRDITTDFYFEKQDGKWLIIDTGYLQ